MRLHPAAVLLLPALAAAGQPRAPAAPPVPVITTLAYDPAKPLHVLVRRAVGTTIKLPPGESITDEPLTGQGSDCDSAEHQWCIVAAVGGTSIGVKPKGGAPSGNTLSIVTEKRTYSFIFDIASGQQAPVLRAELTTEPVPANPMQAQALALMRQAQALMPTPAEVMEKRLTARPLVKNSDYTVAAEQGSRHIVPSAVFDDERNTCLEYRGNRPVPAVFELTPDGQEHKADWIALPDFNLLCVPFVAPGLVLRAGKGVVASVVNHAYDPEGRGPVRGTFADGIERQVADPATGKFKD